MAKTFEIRQQTLPTTTNDLQNSVTRTLREMVPISSSRQAENIDECILQLLQEKDPKATQDQILLDTSSFKELKSETLTMLKTANWVALCDHYKRNVFFTQVCYTDNGWLRSDPQYNFQVRQILEIIPKEDLQTPCDEQKQLSPSLVEEKSNVDGLEVKREASPEEQHASFLEEIMKRASSFSSPEEKHVFFLEEIIKRVDQHRSECSSHLLFNLISCRNILSTRLRNGNSNESINPAELEVRLMRMKKYSHSLKVEAQIQDLVKFVDQLLCFYFKKNVITGRRRSYSLEKDEKTGNLIPVHSRPFKFEALSAEFVAGFVSGYIDNYELEVNSVSLPMDCSEFYPEYKLKFDEPILPTLLTNNTHETLPVNLRKRMESQSHGVKRYLCFRYMDEKKGVEMVYTFDDLQFLMGLVKGMISSSWSYSIRFLVLFDNYRQCTTNLNPVNAYSLDKIMDILEIKLVCPEDYTMEYFTYFKNPRSNYVREDD